ncbi:hypothetical protein NliqN6_0885 [Naganishia liquefaciens]|uniref:Uncharacterized protein n=1 Tax=Naganishia liquefaciens TaxID=104408 RepID=A0A8H3TPD1_9TREE|nr:hypothetical protein NliqN6_0885 [Naganishia liquefaciens]
MSTAYRVNSAIPRASTEKLQGMAVKQNASAPSGSFASRPRATGFAGVEKKQGAGHSVKRSGTLPPQSCISKAAVISRTLPKSSDLQNSGSPYGVPNARNRVTGFGTGARAKQQDAGHSVKPTLVNSTLPKPTLAQTRSSLSSTVCGSQSRNLPQAGAVTVEAAKVKSLKSCVKRANASCSMKSVRFGAAQVREFISQPGDRFPGPAVLFEGEVNWKEWKRQIAKNDEEYVYCQAYAHAINAQLREEETERRDAKAFEDARQRLEHEIFETDMRDWEAEFTSQAEDDEAAGDESGWNLIVYGYNDLLTDEPCPVTEPLDEAFYNDLLKAAEEQERQITEEREEKEKGSRAVAIFLDAVLDNFAAKIEEEENTLATSGSGWNIMQFDGYNPSLVDEPMPFTMPAVHPDTSLELGDISGLLAYDLPMLTDPAREPRCRKVLEHIPEFYVPGVTEHDVNLHREEMISRMHDGILPSATDEDMWERLKEGQTPYLSSKEELFFEVPEQLPFERRYESEFADQSMLTDNKPVGYLALLSPILDTASADNSLRDYDDTDTRFWSDERLRAAVRQLTDPALRRLAYNTTQEMIDDELF